MSKDSYPTTPDGRYFVVRGRLWRASNPALEPDVLIVTGDHSTPAKMKSHSWHPVPTLIVSQHARTDASTAFGEDQCRTGGLGQFEAQHLMLLAMAHAGRLEKYGA